MLRRQVMQPSYVFLDTYKLVVDVNVYSQRNVVYYMHRIVEVYLVDIIMSLIPNVPIQLKKLLSIIYLRT
ncbi:unnamed protein product [Rhizophagus irregularis]|uniref:Uncharacterized protein n=1 Tax=Rhizophagus irregularis TaxID=588596 RepID=A0A915Z5N0_9GLOM|nr:unnamed protein product [Rhizophagus irregularis]CAB5361637.1 unnamed protein product [Rhizophagus irregularis]